MRPFLEEVGLVPGLCIPGLYCYCLSVLHRAVQNYTPVSQRPWRPPASQAMQCCRPPGLWS